MIHPTRTRILGLSLAALTLTVAFAAACGSSSDGGALRRGDAPPGDGPNSTELPDPGGADTDAGERPNAPAAISDSDGAAPDFDAGPNAVQTKIHTLSYSEVCKLITNKNQDDETANHTHSRFNLRGTDLGIPVANNDDLYFFFGDTAGRTIWHLGPESLPDAVGYSGVGFQAAANDPSKLCSNLNFLTIKDGTDFAVGSMTPPPGENIGDYIHNPSGPRGKGAWPNFPGDFEVPSGAFAHNGSIYVFYTIVNLDPFEMRGSYLAKWSSPSPRSVPAYQILYKIDQRFDANGPLLGDFVNIAALVYDDYVYLYGTGKYRQSNVNLARKPLASLDTPGGFERYDADTKTWTPGNQPGAPIIQTPAGGEFSVAYFPEIKKFVTLDSELSMIMARFADKPEGPWSAPVAVVSMVDPVFAAKYCCFDIANPTNDSAPCVGEQLLHCTKAGLYGSYMIPKLKMNPDNSFQITFTVSTWDPYSVALMTATLIDE